LDAVFPDVPIKESATMQDQSQLGHQTRASDTNPVSSHPTVNQRLALAFVSLAFLVFLVNIMGYLSSSFGQVGSTIGLVTICLTVLGINVAFNLDVFRSSH
jgi:hypothetical protein